MKRTLMQYAITFVAGIVVTLGYLSTVPAEKIVRYGLKLAAFETEYDWQALPREATPVSYSTRELMVQAELPKKKPARK